MDMSDKKYIAFNTHLIVLFAGFLLMVSMIIVFAIENHIVALVICSIIALLLIFAFIIFPLYVVFSDEGVEIVYNFGQRERIKWAKIKKITLKGGWIGEGFGSPHYEISYRKKEKRSFFAYGEIPKTVKTTRLLKKYYKREITRW